MQPIAFDFDDRGRLWVVECFSYPDFKVENRDRILIFTDRDGDGRFDERKVFLNQGRRLSGLTLGFGGVWVTSGWIAALPGQERRRHPQQKTRSDARRLDPQGRPQHGQRPGLGTGGLALRPPRHHHALHGRQAGHPGGGAREGELLHLALSSGKEDFRSGGQRHDQSLGPRLGRERPALLLQQRHRAPLAPHSRRALQAHVRRGPEPARVPAHGPDGGSSPLGGRELDQGAQRAGVTRRRAFPHQHHECISAATGPPATATRS